jgi:hypothetical protein
MSKAGTDEAASDLTPAIREEPGMTDTRHVLVVLHDESASQTATRLQGQFKILSRLAPRILVVDPGEHAPADLGREPGVLGVYERDVPADVLARLRQEEQLFVRAWAQQATQEPKVRPGEGLSWDAPGFQPPDAPPGKRP